MTPGLALAATTLTVGPRGDFSTISAALDVADHGDRIEVSAGTYREALRLGDRTLTLVGVDGSDATSIEAAGDGDQASVVTVDGDVVATRHIVTLEGFTIDGRETERGLLVTAADVYGEDLVFVRGADPDALGGPDVLVSGGTFDVAGCDLTYPTQIAADGGHIAVVASTLSLKDCTVAHGGTSSLGGGIAATNSDVTLLKTTIEGNTATTGAGVHVLGEGHSVTIEDSTFEGNRAEVHGGGLKTQETRSLIVRRSTFTSNQANSDGGALDAQDSESVLVEDSAFEANSSQVGGAVWLGEIEKGDVVRSTFVRNDSGRTGGAIHAFRVPLYVAGSTFCSNSAATGGALTLQDLSATVVNSRFQLNVAYQGVLLEADAEVEWLFNTATHNSLDGGTLLDVGETYQVNVVNSAFAANHTVLSGGKGKTEAEYSLFHPSGGPTGGGNLELDPLFVHSNGTCEDDLHPQPDSPLIDGGSPGYADGDGSDADIGMYGGERAPELVDVDGDSVIAEDCDPFDDTVYPGATEQPGDGVDSDCDEAELCYLDEDGDGVGGESIVVGDVECSGDAMSRTSGDCDDLDPERIDDCGEVDTPTEPDVPLPVDPAVLPSAWFCATGPGSGGWLVLGLAMCLVPARRLGAVGV